MTELALGVVRPTGLAMAAVGLGLVVAAADWVAVARADKRAEYLSKPLTLAFFVTAAVILRPGNGGSRWAFTVAALGLSLLGDVFLMLRRERFVAGLGSFLLAHLAYLAAFRTLRADAATLVEGAAVLTTGLLVYRQLRRGMTAKGQRDMAVPVGFYLLAIAAMVTSALVTPFRAGWDAPHATLAVAGALLFMTSDGLIGWTRFVREFGWAKVAIIVTYHLAQALLLLALLV